MRLTLFQAQRRLLEAQMQVDYYRDLVAFLEEVSASGVGNLVGKRRAAAFAGSAQAAAHRSGTEVAPEIRSTG